MKAKDQRDFWAGILFLALGVFFLIYSFEYAMGSLRRMGPGYFPACLGGLLAFVGAIIAIKGLVSRPEDPNDDGRIGSFDWRTLFFILGSLALFGALLTRIGLVASIALLVATCACASRDSRPLEVAVLIAVLDFFVWAVFVYGAQMTVPLWPAL